MSSLIQQQNQFVCPGTKSCVLWVHHMAQLLDARGSCWSDTAQILVRRQHPVALSEALSMPHWVMHDASSQVAAMVIKTDQTN